MASRRAQVAREKLFISKKTSKESNDLRVGDRVLLSLNPDAQSMMTALAALVARSICVLTT
jgi:hypothetical protein